MAAIRERIAKEEINPEIPRSRDALLGLFDQGIDPGWEHGEFRQGGSGWTIERDAPHSAEMTGGSLKMGFSLDNKHPASLINRMRRDMSGYRSVVFYAKASQPLIARIVLIDENPENNAYSDLWFEKFKVEPQWKRYSIPFGHFTIGKKYTQQFPGGDGKLSLNLLRSVLFQVRPEENGKKAGTLWIDEVHLEH